MAATTNANSIVAPTNTIGTTQLSKGAGAKPSNDFLMPYNKGIALLNLGKYNESIAYFDKALAINPKYVGSLSSKGAALFNLGKYNESIAYFDKALAINPNHFISLYNKGAALNKLGKYNESIAYFDKILAIKPTNSHASAGKQMDLAALGIPQDPSMFGFYFGHTSVAQSTAANPVHLTKSYSINVTGTNGIAPKQSSATTQNNTALAPLSSNSSSYLFHPMPRINHLSLPTNSKSSASSGISGSHPNGKISKHHSGYCTYSDYKSNVKVCA